MFTRSMISGAKSECISLGLLGSFSFHRTLRFLTLSLVRIFSSFCQPIRYWLPPSVSQSAPHANMLESVSAKRIVGLRIYILLPADIFQNGSVSKRVYITSPEPRRCLVLDRIRSRDPLEREPYEPLPAPFTTRRRR